MNVTIRTATALDIPAIGRLGALLVRLHHDFDTKRFLAATPQTEQGYGSFLGSQLDEADVIVLVADQDGAVVGYTYAGVEGVDYMSLRGPAGVVYDIVGGSRASWRYLLNAAIIATRMPICCRRRICAGLLPGEAASRRSLRQPRSPLVAHSSIPAWPCRVHRRRAIP
ncbi:MAG: acetyltransferase [Gemmatimonadetes bacterium]|nr:acetyltransferase [Gemmatimonadota bacterium]